METIRQGWNRMWPPFVANLIYSLHYSATLYINSSFLATFYSWQHIALLYAVGATGNIALFVLAPRYLARFGNRSLFTATVVLEALATLGLAYATGPLAAGGWFLLYAAISMMPYYSLDLALEAVTEDIRTGETRGMYLTLADIATAAAPMIVALRAFGSHYASVYISAAVILIPLLLVAPSFPVETASPAQTRFPLRAWWQSADVRHVTLSRGLLEFFYTLMVVFIPVYLHGVIGFSWAETGTMFTIMLLAFVLFEWPVGELADRLWGEREMMTTGFFIMGASVLAMPFLGHNVPLWTLMLFLSRVGATLTEMTCESYFFKHVSAADPGFISIYRTVRPVANILGALLGAAALIKLGWTGVFIVLAFFMLLGTAQSFGINDTL